MKTSQSLTLLIPAYNPSEGWEITFYARYYEFCKAIDQDINVVLINDGSTKDFSKGVDFLKSKIGNHFNYVSYAQNKGKGFALKFGVKSYYSESYMFTDIDFPYSTVSMKNVWEAICSGSPPIVIGHRETAYYDDLSSLRTLLSKGLRWLNKLILNLPVNDTQCGLKAFDKNVRDLLIQCKTDRFLIDLELLLATNKAGYKITPVKVELRKDIIFSTFNSSVLLKEIHNFIKLVWIYRF